MQSEQSYLNIDLYVLVSNLLVNHSHSLRSVTISSDKTLNSV